MMIELLFPKSLLITPNSLEARQLISNDEDLSAYGGVDFAITWSALGDASAAIYNICKNKKVLAICDEHHHAGRDAAWGDGADNAFSKAKNTMVLTGTPVRSDGSETVWMSYDGQGKINHPKAGTYTLSYGAAVDLGYCRPITFHNTPKNDTETASLVPWDSSHQTSL